MAPEHILDVEWSATKALGHGEDIRWGDKQEHCDRGRQDIASQGRGHIPDAGNGVIGRGAVAREAEEIPMEETMIRLISVAFALAAMPLAPLRNAGVLLYNLILAGFDCSKASVGSYDYDLSVIVRKTRAEFPVDLHFDEGDIDKLAAFFPVPVHQAFDGRARLARRILLRSS